MHTLTGFTDEALAGPRGQARMARAAGLDHVELRHVGARRMSVLKAPGHVVDATEKVLRDHGLSVSCIATGLGKVPVSAPLAPQLDDLRRAATLAHRFGTPYVRVFSWHTTTPDADRTRVLDQMGRFTALAADLDVQLIHENEKGVWGDTPQRCLDLVIETGVALIFDPANFVQCGVRPADEAWPMLGDHVAYLHAKDARADTRRVVPVGEGDGQWRDLATALENSGWSGFVSLEPHLGLGGRGGPIGRRRWVRALDTLRGVLAA